MYDLTHPVEKPHSPFVMEPHPSYAARFIDPLSDFGFKRLFGNRSHKKILISFLNAVLRGEKVISDISFNPTEFVGSVETAKKVIFDLMCTAENGEQFIVEMQRAYQEGFTNRLVCYNCRAINEQLPKGKQPVDYDIKQTYSITTVDFILEGSPKNEYVHDVSMFYRGTDLIFSDKQRYILVELPKFDKEIDELITDLDSWVYLLKHMRGMQEVPFTLSQGIFKEVLDIAEVSNLTMEEHKMYRSSLQVQFDYENCLAYAKKEAAKEGREEGREEGRKLGREEGHQLGWQEGLEQGKLAVAQSLITQTDLNDQEIASLAGVEVNVVNRIRSDTKFLEKHSSAQ